MSLTPDASVPPAPVPRRWPGETVAVLGNGPSLAVEDVSALAGAAVRIIAVNDSWKVARRAGAEAALLYAADAKWWDHHKGASGFLGERWTQDYNGGLAAAKRWGLRAVRCRETSGRLSFDPAAIGSGFNSGFQALNLALLFGCRRILLLGFDCQSTGGRKHWFGNHAAHLNQINLYPLWVEAFEAAAQQLRQIGGVEVLNCSRETALACFKRGSIVEAVKGK